jgi:hypothetical protein
MAGANIKSHEAQDDSVTQQQLMKRLEDQLKQDTKRQREQSKWEEKDKYVSLLHDNVSVETKYKGSTLWNAFKNSKADFLDIWILNCNLMSGETSDNDEATIGLVVLRMWLLAKNKAVCAARNRLMKKS